MKEASHNSRDAERALRESEERLRFSLEAGRLGFWQHDLLTGELHCSDLCKINFGRTPDQVITHEEVLECLHPEDRERARVTILEAITQGDPYDLEYRVVWPNGEVRWLMVRGRATYDASGKAVHTLGVTLDITQRKAAEARQIEQAERMRLLSESAEHLLSAAGAESMVRELFDRVRGYLGLDVYLDYVTDPTHGTDRLDSFTGLSDSEVHRIRSRVPTGEMLEALGFATFVFNPLTVGDRRLGLLIFGSRHRAPYSNDEVEFLRTVSHYVSMARERARVADSLREAARRKDEFLAMLAHELRNPLAPIANSLEILRSRSDEPQRQHARDVVQRQVRHMTRLIDDLLDVSRINSGKITLKRERIDLKRATEQALESVRGFLTERQHRVTAELPAGAVHVYADPVRVEQVITNLLNNAGKYTDPGGHISVKLETADDRAVLRVIDTGIGIPHPLLSQVFDLFTQGERGLDRAQGGLGLGLTLVRNLIRMHGGEVEAFSDGPGRGSEFVVMLPLTVAELEIPAISLLPPFENKRRSITATNVRVSRRLLVVDDNRDSAETLAEIIQFWGYEVATEFDGMAALKRAREWEPGMVFLDIGMPGLNGYEVARLLREDDRFRDITLVALTGYGQEQDISRSLAAGFNHHLVKPVDLVQLENLLRGTAPPIP